MSSAEEKNGTIFIWKIENLNCMKEEMLPSPTFHSHSARWEVRISTCEEDTEMISISLHPFQVSRENYSFSLAFLDSDGFPLIWNEKKNFHFDWVSKIYRDEITAATFDNFIEKSEMFGSRKNTILPNNTLTVQCIIWKTRAELVLPLKYFARTRIEPNAVPVVKTFIWNIENIRSFTKSEIRVEEIGGDFTSLTIKLSLNEDDEFEVTFQPTLFRVHIKVNISVMGVTGKNIQFLNDEVQFLRKEQQTLQTNIKKTMLLFHKNLFLNQDALSLQFTCILSSKFTFHDMVNENEILANNPQPTVATSPISEPSKCTDEPESKQPSGSDHSHSILQVLQAMYEGFLSDCVLKIRSRDHPIHKAVLDAKSRVLKGMFATDMKEHDAKCMDIREIDKDTLHKLLRFVYSDRVEEEMGCESVLKLYAAANMCTLESLQRKCSEMLKSGFCVSSVIDVLKLADMHQDQDLKSAAMDYISSNDSEIIGSQNWLTFEKENATLAFETLRKLYLQKVNG